MFLSSKIREHIRKIGKYYTILSFIGVSFDDDDALMNFLKRRKNILYIKSAINQTAFCFINDGTVHQSAVVKTGFINKMMTLFAFN